MRGMSLWLAGITVVEQCRAQMRFAVSVGQQALRLIGQSGEGIWQDETGKVRATVLLVHGTAGFHEFVPAIAAGSVERITLEIKEFVYLHHRPGAMSRALKIASTLGP